MMRTIRMSMAAALAGAGVMRWKHPDTGELKDVSRS